MKRLETKESLDRASRCIDEEKLGEAAELCAAVLGSSPRNARAFYIRAAILRKEGKGQEAAEAACEAARLRPDKPSVVLAAGSLLCREKCFARALALYRTAMAEDPSNAQYHLGAASALRKLGRGEEATAALLKAAAAATSDAGGTPLGVLRVQAHVQYKLGQHLRSTGDPVSCALAAEAYGRCLELDPGHALASFWLLATRKLAATGADGVPTSSQNGSAGNYAGSAVEAGHAHEITSETPPASAPREYVVGLYNAYAETFDSHLQEALEYRTPAIIVESLAVLFPGRGYKRCLDLGCGTGLSGQAASFVCDSLVGIDLSPAMVRKAKEKRLYRRLLVGDVTETVERLHRESKNAPAALGAGTRRPRGWDVPAEPEEEGGAAVAVATAATTTVPGEDEGPAFPAPAVRAPASETAVGEGGATTKSALEGIVATQPGSGRGSDGSCIASASASSAGARGGELVISCDVFVYIGSLRACFKAVHELVTGGRSLIAEPQETGAIFAFSAEAPPATNTTERKEGGAGGANSSGTRPGYELQGTGRYTHSREYLEAVCRDTGFRVLVATEMVLRKNAGVPVRGFIFITEAVLL